MLKEYHRKLLKKEKKKIEDRINKTNNELYRPKKGIFITTFITTIFILLLFLSGPNWYNQSTGIFLGTGVIFCLIGLWSFYSLSIDTKKEIKSLKEILSDNMAIVLHCKTQKYIRFKEYEDLGENLFFQVEDNKILYLFGQLLYATGQSNKLPNSDFEIVYVNEPYFGFWIYIYGDTIKPIKTFSEKESLKMKEDLFSNQNWYNIIDGKLENIEKIVFEK